MADRSLVCPGCKLPLPADWCWEQRMFDCPMSMPPRNIEPRELWRELRDLRSRLDMLEEKDG